MASGCSSGETLSEPEPAAGDLANAISQGIVTEQMLERCAQESRIDIRNKEGQTPLMLACLKGLEDVVKFLLANGANPNSKSLKDGNTPLHYACMLEDTLGNASFLERPSGHQLEPTKWRTPEISIVKLLLNYGASVQNNIDGWSPVCVAAYYLLNDFVDFFLSMGDDDIPVEDKIKASELLGVLQATLGQRPIEDAFHSFCRAINLKEGAGVNEGKVQTSELAACFSKLSLKEFHKLEEIKSVESSESALKAHAILVGEKLFPPSLKQSYFFPSLAYFASRFVFHQEKVESGFQIFSHVLDSEGCGEALPGTVLKQLSYAYHFHQVSYDMNEEPEPLVRQLTRDMLSAYVTVFKNVHIDSLLNVCHSLMQRFSVILFSEAMDWSSRNILKSTLQDIENLLSVIRSRILRERPDEYNKMPSLTFEIMTLVRKDEGVLFNCIYFLREWFLVKIRYMLLRVLPSDNASYQDRSSGNTILHMLAYSTFPATSFGCLKKVMKCIHDLARAFIRHGCSLEAVNHEGQTARDILDEFDLKKKKPNFKLIESLLSPPTTVLQLQETAVRVVLRHKINYQDILPLRLHEMMERVTDSDFKSKVLRKFDNGKSEENSDSNDSSDSSEENSDSDDSSDSENSSESSEDSE
ncbi:protein fem-1 homolog C isoform X1 [Strongylocentrotus purpuratus]|uniref:Uncharacterized protein n=1 Tax=Strongylocentrotus purpuratus TaxID=7668 RepID=A0A7M7PHH0_STRPU|nr:protein fem-1 homolog C isoform X1 [Strongylocentrotus purpuratus]XP_030851954.1 protein fem-1 homolog C isoform X1 [Strongylocentrotus purpuratus]